MLLLLILVGTAFGAATFNCPPEQRSDGAFLCSAVIDVNDQLPSTFLGGLAEHERVPSIVDLLPGNLNQGLFSLMGLGSCCTTKPVIGKICIPGCEPIESITVGAVIAKLDPTDDLTAWTRNVLKNAFSGLDLLPAISLEFYFRPCDATLGLALKVDETVLKNVEIMNLADNNGRVGDVEYDAEARTVSIPFPLPLSVGMLELRVELEELVLGDKGVRFVPSVYVGTGSFAFGIDEEKEVFTFDPVVIGTLDACSTSTSCGACSAVDGCGWCASRQTCHPVDDSSCPCEDACGLWVDTCPPPAQDVCWYTPTDGAPVSVETYEKMLKQLGIFSEEETEEMVAELDSDGDGMISKDEAKPKKGMHPAAIVGLVFLGVACALVVAGLLIFGEQKYRVARGEAPLRWRSLPDSDVHDQQDLTVDEAASQ